MSIEKIKETNETYYYETNEEILEFMLKEISKSKSINELPSKKDLIERLKEKFNYNDDGAEDSAGEVFFGIWVGAKVVIADGTEVRMDLSLRCFNDSYPFEHEIFYYIPEIDTYICLECGLWQKNYIDVKYDVGYDEIGDTKLLPSDWNINGVRAYLAKGAKIQKEKKDNYRRRYEWLEEERKMLGDCFTCRHSKQGMCEYGNDEFDVEDDYCEDFEERY